MATDLKYRGQLRLRAIELFLKKQPNRFKRIGSITKLQKAMGHSSINVSLTYLRGLEIPELTEEDMPVI